MNRILLSTCLLITAAFGLTSLPGCVVHEREHDHVVYGHGHPDWNRHYDDDHHEVIRHEEYREEHR